MSILDEFDFDAAEEVPGMLDYKEIPPMHTDLVLDLEKAAERNDVVALEETLTALRESNARPDLLRNPGSAMILAVELQHTEIVQSLLCFGVQVCCDYVRLATILRSKIMIQMFLNHGWSSYEPLGWSDPPALAYAVEDEQLTLWFLERGADPNASSSALDKTSLAAAVQYAPLSVIELLFSHGGNIHRGQLLHYAVWRKQHHDRVAVVEDLLNKGAKINAVMYEDRPESYLQRETFGLGTTLHAAAANGDMKIIRLLVGRGVHVDVSDSRGCLAYERARACGHDLAAEFLLELTPIHRRKRAMVSSHIGGY